MDFTFIDMKMQKMCNLGMRAVYENNKYFITAMLVKRQKNLISENCGAMQKE